MQLRSLLEAKLTKAAAKLISRYVRIESSEAQAMGTHDGWQNALCCSQKAWIGTPQHCQVPQVALPSDSAKLECCPWRVQLQAWNWAGVQAWARRRLWGLWTWGPAGSMAVLNEE